MKINVSSKTRPARAGRKFGKAVIEMVHLFYLRDNALQFLQTLIEDLNAEFDKRIEAEVCKKIFEGKQ